MQAQICIDDADERDVREVQALRDHLGAEQDVDLADAKICEDAAEVVLALERVRVHALDARVWEEFRERVLDALGAEA